MSEEEIMELFGAYRKKIAEVIEALEKHFTEILIKVMEKTLTPNDLSKLKNRMKELEEAEDWLD